MDVLVERCAALDVHQNTVVACVRLPRPDGGRLQELRAFKATTAGLLGLADWLDSYQVTLVGMEPDRRLLDAGLAGPGGPGLRLAAGRPGTCATCPAARPTWAMRSGCASWSDLVRYAKRLVRQLGHKVTSNPPQPPDLAADNPDHMR